MESKTARFVAAYFLPLATYALSQNLAVPSQLRRVLRNSLRLFLHSRIQLPG